ncbi:MAG: hypothetical protein H0U87_09840 [Acidobacteria bacterium]|nr:hypothetical protein [Acidobacteriota bacterium]
MREEKEASNRNNFGETVGNEDVVFRMRGRKNPQRLLQFQTSLSLEPSKNAVVQNFTLTGASPLMRERRINAFYDAQISRRMQPCFRRN